MAVEQEGMVWVYTQGALYHESRPIKTGQSAATFVIPDGTEPIWVKKDESGI